MKKSTKKTFKPKKSADDMRQAIADIMVKALSENTPPWRKSWSESAISGLPCNFQSGRRYTGINPLILMFTAMACGYKSKFWGSYDSWLKHVGAHVKRDEKSATITYFTMCPKRDLAGKILKNSNNEDIMFPLMKEFHVFNADQVQAPTVETLLDGRNQRGGVVGVLLGNGHKARIQVTTREELLKIAARHLPAKSQPKDDWSERKIAKAIHDGIKAKLAKYVSEVAPTQNNEPDYETAEVFIKATGAIIQHGGDRACCNRESTVITMPEKRQFKSMADYYETLCHELIHWTQPEDRVGIKKFEDPIEQYAFNELVAEIGACLLLVELNVPMADEMLEQSKSYVKGWLSKMKSDPKYIFDAATQAGKAVDFLLTFIGRQNPVYEESDAEKAA